MIKRIFKTILILTICLGITLPTNAAVSVSDGSAFVTKAEFSADVNNLSNRMAQLENSLDAKIDSLVSSYLTRNGIWNGAIQDLETYYIVDFFGSTTKANTCNITNGYRGFQGKTQEYTATYKALVYPPSAVNSDYLEHTVERTKKVIVHELNKSGMLYMTVNLAPTALLWTGSSADNRTWISFQAGVNDPRSSTVYGTIIKWNFQFGIEGGVPFGEVNAMQEAGIIPFFSGSWVQLWGKLGFQQAKILTFVEKGKQVYCRDYFLFKRNTANGTLDTATKGTSSEWGGMIMTVDDCAVY